MLGGIVGFEWRYATRRVTFAATAAVLAVLGYVLASTGFGADDIHVNSPYAIAYSIGFLSLTSVFALTVLVAPSLLRDTEHQMAEIVYATSVTKTQYLLGRLAGSFLAAATAFLAGIAGMVAGSRAHEAERLMPFAAGPYLWALAVFALPSMAFVAALLFAMAALTRSTLATYIGGVIVYVLYFVAAVVAGSPLLASSGPVSAQEMAVAALADPFGLSAIFEQTQYWTAAERDLRPLALAGSLLANRVGWLAAAIALVAVAHRRFAFRLPSPRRRAEGEDAPPPASRATYAPVPVRASTPPAALRSAIRLEIRALLRSWPFAAILILWAGTAFMTVFEELRRAEYGTALHPTAGLIVRHLGQPLLLFGVLVVVYFAGEAVWRERGARVAEIVDATPAGSAVFAVSKTVSLWLLVAVLIAVAIVVGMVLQVASGDHPMRPALLGSLFYFGGVPLALFAVLAVLIQALSPNRHAGLLATLAAAVFLPLGGPGGPEHPLLRYGYGGAVSYSDMNGFGPAATVFASLAVYWGACAGVLAVVAAGAWPRGTDARFLRRLRQLPRRLDGRSRVVAATCVVVWVVAGTVLFRQMNVVSGYETPDERSEWRAAYERTYAAIDDRPQPAIGHIAAEVDLFPDQRRYRVRARYRLRNRAEQAITSVSASVPRGVRVAAMTLDGRPPTRDDSRFRVRTFDVRMEPGTEAELAFELEVDRAAAAAVVENDIVPNGSFVFGPSVFPALGYRRSYEIDDAAERRKRGLPDRPARPPRVPELATFDVVVTAPADQTVVAPGVVRGTGEREGRRWTRFAVERPVQPILAFASARYAVARATAGAVEVEVLHHPSHGANVGRILEAAARSLEYCTREFGPYPYPQLRIAETPSYDDRFGGYAVPGVVYLTEDRAFLTDLRDEGRIDIVTKRTAHEVAHQWWGHQVVPTDGPGASAVVETPPRYAELMILKERYGEGAVRQALQVELGRYLSGRRGEAEVPLERVEDQAYIYYAKGALVMTALADLVGEAQVNAALRAVVARAGEAGTGARDVLEELRRVTPAADRPLLDEWWTRVVLYDLGIASARATPLPGGRFRVDLRVKAARSEVADGRETALPLDDAIEIAVYGGHPDRSGAPPLSLARHRLREVTDLSIVVDGTPAYVAIDPNLRRIDRNPDDNLRRVEAPAGE